MLFFGFLVDEILTFSLKNGYLVTDHDTGKFF